MVIWRQFGAPTLGTMGAAVAIVISRIIECLIVVVWTQQHLLKYEYL